MQAIGDIEELIIDTATTTAEDGEEGGMAALHAPCAEPVAPRVRDPDSATMTRNADTLIGKVFADTCDAIVWGYGCPVDDTQKQTPHRANPLDKPPPHRDRTGRRTWATIKAIDRQRHTTGERPLFTAGCANRCSRIWGDEERLAYLWAAMAGMSGDDAEQAAAEIIERPRLLPQKLVEQAHRIRAQHEARRAAQLLQQTRRLTQPVQQLIVYLVQLEPGTPDWWLARRLLEEARTWKLTPRKWGTVAVDIDGDGTPSGAHAAQELAAAIALDLLAPHDIPNIVERSRSRTGAYLRLFVALGAIDTDTYNRSLDALCTMLRDRYGTLSENGDAGVCSVKGKLCEWRPNPRYNRDYAHEVIDRDTGRTNAGRYEWKRRNAGDLCNGKPIKWRYNTKLEPLVLGGAIDLITAPIHGLHRDPDGGHRRIEDWQWLLDQRKRHAPTAASLFELLGVEPGLAAAAAAPAHEPIASVQPTRHRSNGEVRPITVSVHAPRPETPDGQALYGPDRWRSYLAAGRVAMRRTGGDVEQAACLARQIREDAGVADGFGDRDRDQRLMHSRRAAQYAARTFDPSRAGTGQGCSYVPDRDDVEHMLDELPRHIPAYLIRFENDKQPAAQLTMERLAIGMATIQGAMHDDVGEQGAVTRDVILAALANYQGRNPHNSTAGAIVNVLQETGLISVTRKPRPGQCRMFQLARHCPLVSKVANLPRERRLVASQRRPEPLRAPQVPYPPDNVRSALIAPDGRLSMAVTHRGAIADQLQPARAGPGPDPPVETIA